MSKPTKTIWQISPHTIAKHTILRRYLEAWLPIMSSRAGRLVYIDGFAGPGVYEGGESGSPIVALRAFLDHKYRDRIEAELVYVFIEEDAARYARLNEEIGRLGKLPDQVKVGIHHGSYEEIFSGAIDELEEEGGALAPTFAFVDPFGYSAASMHLSGRFLQFRKCEVLIYVPLSYIARFVGRAGQEKALTSLYGTDKWRHAIPLHGKDRLSLLHDLFRDQMITECGLKFVRSFEIVTKKANTGYHLFFGTKHERGLERMKDAMWAMDPAKGECFRDSTLSNAQAQLFAPQVDTKPLLKALRSHFGTETFSIRAAERFTLVHTPYRVAHLRRLTLTPAEKRGELEIAKASATRKRGAFPVGTKMRFLP